MWVQGVKQAEKKSICPQTSHILGKKIKYHNEYTEQLCFLVS